LFGDPGAVGRVRTQQLPTISVLMPAYNYARYVARAITSVLEQDYPPELLRLVVVDDGSTDDTAAVVQELVRLHPARVQLIQQPNAGASAAYNTALAAAAGDLIAILDADDVWLPQKTRRQVDEFIANPDLGMVFCDMLVVDQHEATVRPSQVGNIGAFPRRAFARLLCQNVATASSIVIRRDLAKPLLPEVPYSDWWFALCAAEHDEVLYIPEPLALYREHGANLTSGVSGAAGVREHRKEIAFQLWALRNMDLDSLTDQEVALVWSGVEEHAGRALRSAGTFFATLVDVSEHDRRRGSELAQEAKEARGGVDGDREAVLLLRSLGHDPYATSVLLQLHDALGIAR
jgi:glycosyltransferase involved in cell wall biosynthesis